MSTPPSSTPTKVSIIIPHYNYWCGLRLCLDSVLQQSYPKGRTEIIVVDNNSDRDLEPFKIDYPDVIFVTEMAQGAAHARNKGMTLATGDVFAFIDADCVADTNWLREGVKALGYCDASGGEVLVSMSDAPNGVEMFEKIFAFRQSMYINRKGFAATANLIVKKSVAKQIGWFVNGVSEDLEWCLRGQALGFCLTFNDNSIVTHPARGDWSELTIKWRRLIAERRNGLKGHILGQRLRWLGLAAITAISFPPHCWQILRSDRLTDYQSKIKAMLVLVKIRLWRARHMVTVL